MVACPNRFLLLVFIVGLLVYLRTQVFTVNTQQAVMCLNTAAEKWQLNILKPALPRFQHVNGFSVLLLLEVLQWEENQLTSTGL